MRRSSVISTSDALLLTSLAGLGVYLTQPPTMNSKSSKTPGNRPTAGYSSTPLPKKLGIKAGTVVSLLNAPPDFRKSLGELPSGARISLRISKSTTLAIWFVDRRNVLDSRLPRVNRSLLQGSIWIAWPKKASGVATDLSESVVRESGLAVGLVDYKVCAIDYTWSGLLFTRRKTRRE
jgi:hypothetical protein